MRIVGASEDDLTILAAKKFIIPFDNGVVVIKHWRIHNYIRKDTYNETNYKEEKALLELDENKAYRLDLNSVNVPATPRGLPVDTGKVRLGKDSIGKVSKEKDKPKGLSKKKNPEDRNIIPPTVEMVREYCNERKNDIDPENFVDFYTSKGWKIGKDKMKDWQATVRTWEKNRKKETKKNDDLEGWLND
jgi:hypothetical protein